MPSDATVPLDLTEFYVGDVDPMYVQRWQMQSAEASARRAVLVHGGAHTGMCWTRRPSGQPGWAQHLASRGWTVYVLDWPGVGRSRRGPNYLQAGAEPVVTALCALLGEVGSSVVIGHSIGAALLAKVIDEVPELVKGFLAVAPAPPGNVSTGRPAVPVDRPLVFSPVHARELFTNADRFPTRYAEVYLRSLSDCSPSITNALGSRGGLDALVIENAEAVRDCPSVVLVGEQDKVTPPDTTREIAEFLNAPHVLLGADWNLEGFGHMIPIEDDSEQVLDKALEILALVS